MQHSQSVKNKGSLTECKENWSGVWNGFVNTAVISCSAKHMFSPRYIGITNSKVSFAFLFPVHKLQTCGLGCMHRIQILCEHTFVSYIVSSSCYSDSLPNVISDTFVQHRTPEPAVHKHMAQILDYSPSKTDSVSALGQSFH